MDLQVDNYIVDFIAKSLLPRHYVIIGVSSIVLSAFTTAILRFIEEMALGSPGSSIPKSSRKPQVKFRSKKILSDRDMDVVDMLNSQPDEISFIVTDPDLDDHPIVYASDAFCELTGYSRSEIQGRNCRFLQGKDTSQADIQKIRDAIFFEREENVCIRNYKKDGTLFINQFYILPLFDSNDRLMYYLGVQAPIPAMGVGQQYLNPGWVHALCRHD